MVIGPKQCNKRIQKCQIGSINKIQASLGLKSPHPYLYSNVKKSKKSKKSKIYNYIPSGGETDGKELSIDLLF